MGHLLAPRRLSAPLLLLLLYCLLLLPASAAANEASRHERLRVALDATAQRVRQALAALTIAAAPASASSVAPFSAGTRASSSLAAAAREDCAELLEGSLQLLAGAGAPAAAHDDSAAWLSAALTNHDTCADGLVEAGVSNAAPDHLHLAAARAMVRGSLAMYMSNNAAEPARGCCGGRARRSHAQPRRRRGRQERLRVQERDHETRGVRRSPAVAAGEGLEAASGPRGGAGGERRHRGGEGRHGDARHDIGGGEGGAGVQRAPDGDRREGGAVRRDREGGDEEDEPGVRRRRQGGHRGGRLPQRRRQLHHLPNRHLRRVGVRVHDARHDGGELGGASEASGGGAARGCRPRRRPPLQHPGLPGHAVRALQFYRDCDVYGTVDFVFGNAAAVLQRCNLWSRAPLPRQKNTVIAQNRLEPCQDTGLVLHACRVVAAPDLIAPSPAPAPEHAPPLAATYLGRLWRPYSRVVVMMSYIGAHVSPEGWLEWNASTSVLDTLYYGEYMNYGPGAGVAGRVAWRGHHVINDTVGGEERFTVAQFIAGASWLPATGVSFVAGLSV